MFIVRYCMEEMYRMRMKLVVIAIELENAFDSLGRFTLVKALKLYYKYGPNMIHVIVDLYMGG